MHSTGPPTSSARLDTTASRLHACTQLGALYTAPDGDNDYSGDDIHSVHIRLAYIYAVHDRTFDAIFANRIPCMHIIYMHMPYPATMYIHRTYVWFWPTYVYRVYIYVYPYNIYVYTLHITYYIYSIVYLHIVYIFFICI